MNEIVFVQVTKDELNEMIVQAFQGLAGQLSDQSKVQTNDDLISRKQAANVLGISLPTLHEYTKRGILPAYRIGSRIRYKQGEILDCLRKVQAKKFHA